jgi:DNA-binding SARP family transcriptional activator
MSLLWGSHFDVQAQQNLRKALSRLRQALGGEVFANGDELVSLRPGAVACDATAFERLIEEGSRESLRAATDLCPRVGPPCWQTRQAIRFRGPRRRFARL